MLVQTQPNNFAGRKCFTSNSLNSYRQMSCAYTIFIRPQEQIFNVFPAALLQKTMLAFSQELEQKQDRLKHVDVRVLIEAFASLAYTFLQVNTTAIHTQITSMNSLVVKAETNLGNVYTELFFNETTGWLEEAVVNIFHNQEEQLSIAGNLDAAILAIKQYFGIEEIDYSTYLNQSTAYALPGGSFATSPL
jgi:hypothetical protein